MKCNHRTRHLQLAIALAAAGLVPGVHAQEPQKAFKYSDEWSLVSAPPPAGPYQPINIDPRVPGPGTIPQVPMPIPRLQAADEMPAATDVAGEAVAADIPAGTEAGEPVMMQAAPEPDLTMPPVPGHYRPVMPLPTGAIAAESSEAAEPLQAETETVAVPAAVIQPPAGDAAPALASEAGEAAEPLQADTETVAAPVAVIQTPAGDAAPALAIEAGEAAEPLQAETETVAVPAPDSLPVEQDIPAPAMAGTLPPAYVGGERPATGLQPGQPYYPQQQAMPGFYDRLPPPAAGRMGERAVPQAPSPAESLPEAPGAEYAPAPGYYGRRAPAAGYGYQTPGYPYQGMPGYRGMPSYGYPQQGQQWSGEQGGQPYGYPGAQTWSGEQDVPPPPVYDSMQRPREPIQGYR